MWQGEVLSKVERKIAMGACYYIFSNRKKREPFLVA